MDLQEQAGRVLRLPGVALVAEVALHPGAIRQAAPAGGAEGGLGTRQLRPRHEQVDVPDRPLLRMPVHPCPQVASLERQPGHARLAERHAHGAEAVFDVETVGRDRDERPVPGLGRGAVDPQAPSPEGERGPQPVDAGQIGGGRIGGESGEGVPVAGQGGSHPPYPRNAATSFATRRPACPSHSGGQLPCL